MSIESKHFYRFNYLKSEHWQTLRIARIAKSNGRCEICQKEEGISLDVHHVSYKNSLYSVKNTDLRALCRECHNIVHAVLERFPELYNKKDSHWRWLRVGKKVGEFRRYARRYGQDCAFAAMELRKPYLKWRKNQDKIRAATKRDRQVTHQIKHLVLWYGGWFVGHYANRVISKIEND